MPRFKVNLLPDDPQNDTATKLPPLPANARVVDAVTEADATQAYNRIMGIRSTPLKYSVESTDEPLSPTKPADPVGIERPLEPMDKLAKTISESILAGLQTMQPGSAAPAGSGLTAEDIEKIVQSKVEAALASARPPRPTAGNTMSRREA